MGAGIRSDARKDDETQVTSGDSLWSRQSVILLISSLLSYCSSLHSAPKTQILLLHFCLVMLLALNLNVITKCLITLLVKIVYNPQPSTSRADVEHMQQLVDGFQVFADYQLILDDGM